MERRVRKIIGKQHAQAHDRVKNNPTAAKGFPQSYPNRPATPVANQADAGGVDKSGDQG